MKILVIDNYDSFTYNLVHYIEQLVDVKCDVYRNDEISLEDVGGYDKILLSPGPGIPDEANLLKPIIEKYAASKSMLGVCLGHQAIGEVFGAKLLNTRQVFHGVASSIKVKTDEPLFNGLEKNIEVGRYHSWVIDPKGFPEEIFDITAQGENGEVMAIRHKQYDVCGVQFHPESVLTPNGLKIVENWLNN